MSGWTPTTGAVRHAATEPFGERICGAEFDRWLAEHDAEIRTAALETANKEIARYKANEPPCDGGCNVNDGPAEECSAHGRIVAQVWEIADKAMRERDQQVDTIAAVKRYANDRAWYGQQNRVVGSNRIASDLLAILARSTVTEA